MNTLLNVRALSVDRLVLTVSSAVELMAAVVVGYGAISAFYQVVTRLMIRRMASVEYERIRIGLARALVLGLEFELGADLLKAAISPTWSSIGIVAAIVVLRSSLNFMLEKDITQMETRLARESGQAEEESG